MSPIVGSAIVVAPLLCVFAFVGTVFVRWTMRGGSAPTWVVRAALGVSVVTAAVYAALAILPELRVAALMGALASLTVAVLAARDLRGRSRS